MSSHNQNRISECPLCTNVASTYYHFKERHFFQCKTCFGIFLEKKLRLNRTEEIKRYKLHDNDINDKKYQDFVSPISTAIFRDYNQNHYGLDFGAGSGPVITKILRDHQFQIVLYDPYFYNFPTLLETSYDYIVCCEVIEHFYNPKKEFTLLKKLMNNSSKLYCMTELYDDSMDFHNWYYKNDPTHVFLYQEETIHWIKLNYNFSKVKIEGRLITYSE